jgi:hypothetical protein
MDGSQLNDFFGKHSGRRSVKDACGGLQPAAAPSLAGLHLPTPPGGKSGIDLPHYYT